MRHKQKRPEHQAQGKKKIIADAKNYYVTQPHVNTAAREKERLASGINAGNRSLAYRDGVLVIQALENDASTS